MVVHTKKNKEESIIKALRALPPQNVILIVGTFGKRIAAEALFRILQDAGKDPVMHDFGELESLKPRELSPNGILILCIPVMYMKLLKDMPLAATAVILTSITDPGNLISKTDFFEGLKAILNTMPSYGALSTHADIAEILKKEKVTVRAKLLMPEEDANTKDVLLLNTLLAANVGDFLKVSKDILKDVIKHPPIIPGSAEKMHLSDGTTVINDAGSILPETTLAALHMYGGKQNVVLIVGGKDHGRSINTFLEELQQYVTAVILLSGTGTMRLYRHLSHDMKTDFGEHLEDAFQKAIAHAKTNDIIIYSPGFFDENGGVGERNQKFRSILRNLKG